MTFREEDVTARLDRFSERLDALESGREERLWVRRLEAVFPYFVAVSIIGSVLFLLGYAIHGCNASERAAAEGAESRCVTLCESMGLRGGVSMPWRSTAPSGFPMTGYACLCGDGAGSEVRVDPDGVEEAARLRAADAGAP
jgi:hypothetical protein